MNNERRIAAYMNLHGYSRAEAVAKIKQNPAPRTNAPKAAKKRMSKKAYVNRPSQAKEQRAPSPRLKARRKANLAAPKGVYPNPLKSGITARARKSPTSSTRKMLSVDYAKTKDGPWTIAGIFPNRQLAVDYARTMADKNDSLYWRVATL